MDATLHPASRRLPLIDALRGLAALWVFLFHAYKGEHVRDLLTVLPEPATMFFSAGWAGVPIFFVLSGYVISCSVAKYTVDGRFVGRFVLRRSLRIDPPYWASMVVVMAAATAYAMVGRAKFHFPTARQVLVHMFYLQDILRVPAISVVYWTLCLEIQFYVAFCLLMWAVHSLRRRLGERARSLVFAPALIVAGAWPALLLPAPWPGSWLPTWYGFMLGMLAFWTVSKTSPRWLFYAFGTLVAIGCARMGLAGEYSDALWPGVCIATATLLMEAGRAGKIGTWMNWKPLQFLGLVSYSVYLIHSEILTIAYGVVHRVVGRSPIGNATALLVVLLIVVGSAWILWRLVERPTQALAQRIQLDGPAGTAPPAPTTRPA